MEDSANVDNATNENYSDFFKTTSKELEDLVQDAIKNRHDNPDDYVPPTTILKNDSKQKELVLLPKKKR